MLLGIVSDTHDQYHRTGLAIEQLRLAGAEVLVHCGDLTSPHIVHLCGELPAYYVQGNNDDDPASLRAAIESTGGHWLGNGGVIEIAGVRIGVTHGDIPRVQRDIVKEQPDYLLTGHTHVSMDEMLGGVRWINPGALHRARCYSVALLDLSCQKLEILLVR